MNRPVSVGLQVLDPSTEWLISQLLQILLEKDHPRYCANKYFTSWVCVSGIVHHKQTGLRVTARAKTHQSWAWVHKPWLLGLVLEFDLLTESIRVGRSRGAKLLQGLILSLFLTVNSWWNPPLALGAICQGGTSRPPHKGRTTFGRE